MAELLEATRKMKTYFKDDINIANHILLIMAVTTSVQIIIVHLTQTNTDANLAPLMIKSIRLYWINILTIIPISFIIFSI